MAGQGGGIWGGAPIVGGTATREYSPLEVDKIQAACIITDAEWNASCPDVYPQMLEEGQKVAKVRAVLTELMCLIDPSSLTNVQVATTDDMAKDQAELNFGYGNDTTYATCHCGISPFAVVAISLATASRRQRQSERLQRATFLSINDLADNNSIPDLLPTNHLGLVDLLWRYLIYLRVVVGERCTHYSQVQCIAVELTQQAATFEAMSR